MMFPFCTVLNLLGTEPAGAWYGPQVATFQVQFAGNPYDPAENDVVARFKNKKGVVEQRLAFFNPTLGSWQAILVAREPGTFDVQLVRNGRPVDKRPQESHLILSKKLPHGYVHADAKLKNRFRWDDGSPEVPIGFNLGWQDNSIIPITEQLQKMGKSGVNWARIWACTWDGKNPWWPQDSQTKLSARELWPPALTKWDSIERSAESSGIGIQFVLFHHGEFSSQVDPNWKDNPWNAKNGGFLQKPGDFFTDPEAKRRAKIWLRYAVARYGASPAVFAWELFNEVQWVDPIHVDHRWDEVEAWHREMADYVRSIDPYHHPVTSSSELRPMFDSSLDYLQPHTYPNNVLAAILGTKMPPDKPGFYGEFGPGDTSKADFRQVVRDGLLAGLLANHAGAGMFWYWDRVEKLDLYSEFAVGTRVAEISNWWGHPFAKTAAIRVETSDRSRFSFKPGLGWATSTQMVFHLPDGADPQSLGKLSSFVQGKAHREMLPQPIELKFVLPRPSTMTIAISSVSDSGGSLAIAVDGTDAFQGSYKKGDHPQPIDVALGPGTHTVSLSNDGPDWVNLEQISIGNLAPQADVEALSEQNWMLLRVTRTDHGTKPLHIKMSAVPLADGQYDVKVIDLSTGILRRTQLKVEKFETAWDAANADEALVFNKLVAISN